jgi:CHAT domain-containing protein/tetratricopeptide (TPR) repeat protein
LRSGETIEGVTTDGDPVVETEALASRYSDTPVVGKTFVLSVSEVGPHFIDLHSHFFNAYLILWDDQGRVIEENDDTGAGHHSRVSFIPDDVASQFRVDVCAPNGERGAFTLMLLPGTATPDSHRTAALEHEGDVRERVRVLEGALEPSDERIGTAYNDLGVALYVLGRYEEAETPYRRALDLRLRYLGREHAETAWSFNNLALNIAGLGRFEEAEPLYEECRSIRADLLGREHPHYAQVLNNLGEVAFRLGRVEDALKLFLDAKQIYESAVEANDPDLGATLSNLGAAYERLGQYEEATPLRRRYLEICIGAFGDDHPSTAISKLNLGSVLADRGRHTEALPLHRDAVRVLASEFGDQHSLTMVARSHLSSTLRGLGEYDEARVVDESLVADRRRVLGERHVLVGDSLNSLALTLIGLGQLDEPAEILEEVLAIYQSSPTSEHRKIGRTLNNMALLAVETGAMEEARDLLERALAMEEQASGTENPNLSYSLMNLGNILGQVGEYQAAMAHLDRAHRLTANAYGERHPTIGQVHRMRGVAARTAGQLEEAAEYDALALELSRDLYGADHPASADALYNLATTLADLGRLSEAWSLVTEALESSGRHVESAFWVLSEAERFQLAAHYQHMFDMALSLGAAVPQDEGNEIVYDAVLRWKGRVSRSLLADHDISERHLTAEQRGRIEELREVQGSMSKLFFGTSANPDEYERTTKALRRRGERIEAELARSLHSPGLGGASLDELQSVLPDRTATLDFVVYEKRGYPEGGGRTTSLGRHVGAWIVRSGDDAVRRIELGPVDPLERLLQGPAEGPVGQRGIGVVSSGRTDLSEIWHALAVLVWEPLEPHLAEVESLFISPDDLLGAVPFGVLESPKGVHLIEKHGLVYLQDLSSLIPMLSQPRAHTDGLLAVGSVDFDERGVWPGNNATTGSSLRPLIDEAWVNLPGTRREVEAVVSLHTTGAPSGPEAVLLAGAEATEERIKREFPKHGTVHLATHGFFRPPGLEVKTASGQYGPPFQQFANERARVEGLSPGLLSGIVCAGANLSFEQGRDDGYLTAEEIEWLDLGQVGLVTMSACETGLGRPQAGEGMLGLRRALHIAGVQTVVSSLWNVQDESTAELMRDFYTNLWVEKMGRLESLRQAQLKMLNKNRAEHGDARPATWGAFVLSGDWR